MFYNIKSVFVTLLMLFNPENYAIISFIMCNYRYFSF